MPACSCNIQFHYNWFDYMVWMMHCNIMNNLWFGWPVFTISLDVSTDINKLEKLSYVGTSSDDNIEHFFLFFFFFFFSNGLTRYELADNSMQSAASKLHQNFRLDQLMHSGFVHWHFKMWYVKPQPHDSPAYVVDFSFASHSCVDV